MMGKKCRIKTRYAVIQSHVKSTLTFMSVLEEGYLIEEGGLIKLQKRYKRGVLIEEVGPIHFIVL